jgi:hypothetical protein
MDKYLYDKVIFPLDSSFPFLLFGEFSQNHLQSGLVSLHVTNPLFVSRQSMHQSWFEIPEPIQALLVLIYVYMIWGYIHKYAVKF